MPGDGLVGAEAEERRDEHAVSVLGVVVLATQVDLRYLGLLVVLKTAMSHHPIKAVCCGYTVSPSSCSCEVISMAICIEAPPMSMAPTVRGRKTAGSSGITTILGSFLGPLRSFAPTLIRTSSHQHMVPKAFLWLTSWSVNFPRT